MNERVRAKIEWKDGEKESRIYPNIAIAVEHLEKDVVEFDDKGLQLLKRVVVRNSRGKIVYEAWRE